MNRVPILLFFLSIAGVPPAMAQTELVIPVTDAEAATIIQEYRRDELQYEEINWRSNGRVRLVKLNIEALKTPGDEVQFTPFADVAPIVMTSNGLGGKQGNHWTGERYYNRVDTLPSPAEVEAELSKLDEVTGTQHDGSPVTVTGSTLEFIREDIRREFEQANRVELSLGSTLMDTRTGEYLLDPGSPHAEDFVINAYHGRVQSVTSLELKYKGYVEKAGLEYPCEKRPIPQNFGAPDANSAGGFGGGVIENQTGPQKRVELIDMGTGHVTNAKDGYRFDEKHNFAVPCKPARHVLDRIARLPVTAKKHSTTDQYRRAERLPPSARYIETVGGVISDKSTEPFAQDETVRHFRIEPLTVNRDYHLVYEIDRSRDVQPPIDLHDYGLDGAKWSKTEAAKRQARLQQEKAAHMSAAKATRNARNNGRGGKQ